MTASRFLVGPIRVSAITFERALRLALAATQRGDKLSFQFRSANGVAEQFAQRMTERLPGLIIVGTDTPPFRPLTANENDAAIERINAADPDCVWLGVSTPKLDIWLFENRERINAPVVLAVGAAFDLPLADTGAALDATLRT